MYVYIHALFAIDSCMDINTSQFLSGQLINLKLSLIRLIMQPINEVNSY